MTCGKKSCGKRMRMLSKHQARKQKAEKVTYMKSPILAALNCVEHWEPPECSVEKTEISRTEAEFERLLGNLKKRRQLVPDNATKWFIQIREMERARKLPPKPPAIPPCDNREAGISPYHSPPTHCMDLKLEYWVTYEDVFEPVKPVLMEPLPDIDEYPYLEANKFKRVSPEFLDLLQKNDLRVLKLHPDVGLPIYHEGKQYLPFLNPPVVPLRAKQLKWN